MTRNEVTSGSRVEVNLNVQATVNLTDEGRRVLARYCGKFPEEYREQIPPNGEYVAPLWRLMYVFGPRCFMGADQCFKGNLVKLQGGDSMAGDGLLHCYKAST